MKNYYNVLKNSLYCTLTILLFSCGGSTSSNGDNNQPIDPQSLIKITYTQTGDHFSKGNGSIDDPYQLEQFDKGGGITLAITNNGNVILNNFIVDTAKIVYPYEIKTNECEKLLNHTLPIESTCKIIIQVNSSKLNTFTLQKDSLLINYNQEKNQTLLTSNIVTKVGPIPILKILINTNKNAIVECNNLLDDCTTYDKLPLSSIYISAFNKENNNLYLISNPTNGNNMQFLNCLLTLNQFDSSACYNQSFQLEGIPTNTYNITSANTHNKFVYIMSRYQAQNKKYYTSLQKCEFNGVCKNAMSNTVIHVPYSTTTIFNDNIYFNPLGLSTVSYGKINADGIVEQIKTSKPHDNNIITLTVDDNQAFILTNSGEIKSCNILDDGDLETPCLSLGLPIDKNIRNIQAYNHILYLTYDKQIIKYFYLYDQPYNIINKSFDSSYQIHSLTFVM